MREQDPAHGNTCILPWLRIRHWGAWRLHAPPGEHAAAAVSGNGSEAHAARQEQPSAANLRGSFTM